MQRRILRILASFLLGVLATIVSAGPSQASDFELDLWNEYMPDDAYVENYEVEIDLSKSAFGYPRMHVTELVTLQWNPDSTDMNDFMFRSRDDFGEKWALFNNNARILSGDSKVVWPVMICGKRSCSGSDQMTIRAPSDDDPTRRVIYESTYTVVGYMDVTSKEWVSWRYPATDFYTLTRHTSVMWHISPELAPHFTSDPCEYPAVCNRAADGSWLRVTSSDEDMNEAVRSYHRLGFDMGTFNTGNANWWGNDWLILFWVFGGGAILLLGLRVGWRLIVERVIPWWRTNPTIETPLHGVGQVGALIGAKTRTGYAVMLDLAIRGYAVVHAGTRTDGVRGFEIQFRESTTEADSAERELIGLFVKTYRKSTLRYALSWARSDVILEGIKRVEAHFRDLNDETGLTALKWFRNLLHVLNVVSVVAAFGCLVLGLGLFDIAAFGIYFTLALIGVASWFAIQRGPSASRAGLNVINHAGDLEAFIERQTAGQTEMLAGHARDFARWESYLPWWLLLGKSDNWLRRIDVVALPTEWPSWISAREPFSAEALAEVLADLNLHVTKQIAQRDDADVDPKGTTVRENARKLGFGKK